MPRNQVQHLEDQRVKLLLEKGSAARRSDYAACARIDQQLEDLNQRIKDIRERCEHAFEYEGSYHHNDYYRCQKCDATEWRR